MRMGLVQKISISRCAVHRGDWVSTFSRYDKILTSVSPEFGGTDENGILIVPACVLKLSPERVEAHQTLNL